MSNKELRELDCWIAEHLFGWKDIRWLPCTMTWRGIPPNLSDDSQLVPSYSTFKADAMEVLEKCGERCCVVIEKCKDGWIVARVDYDWGDQTDQCETLPLAICLFARKLFEQ